MIEQKPTPCQCGHSKALHETTNTGHCAVRKCDCCDFVILAPSKESGEAPSKSYTVPLDNSTEKDKNYTVPDSGVKEKAPKDFISPRQHSTEVDVSIVAGSEGVTMKDVVDGTPKGQAAVDRALEGAARDQEEMHRAAEGISLASEEPNGTCNIGQPGCICGYCPPATGGLDEIFDRLFANKHLMDETHDRIKKAKAALQAHIREQVRIAEKLGYARGLLKGRADMRTQLKQEGDK